MAFVADHPLQLVCAGRTDAGVHAVEQVAHFDSTAERDERAWVLGTNCRLPKDIRLKWVVPVADEFHARYAARARSYRYVIANTRVADALFHDLAAWEFRPLDEVAMNRCAQVLVGEHDFSSFRAVGCQSKSSMRNVHQVSVSRRGDLLYLDIEANAFLYHMVRNIAGSLIEIGKGECDQVWFEQVFDARDRNLAAPTAAASGLYFVRAFYDDKFALPMNDKKPVLF